MNFRGSMSLLLLGVFLWCAYYAHWFDVIRAWTPDTYAICVLGILIGFTISNEFYGGHR